jgi:hypothetical protein
MLSVIYPYGSVSVTARRHDVKGWSGASGVEAIWLLVTRSEMLYC